MRTLRILLNKEFRQIFRNPVILRLIFIVPIVQLIILPLAANYEVKNIKTFIVDHDRSSYSRNLIQKILSSGNFVLSGYGNSYNEAYTQIQNDKSDLIIEIPPQFEKDIMVQKNSFLFIAVNAINGMKANMGSIYLNEILQSYSTSIVATYNEAAPSKGQFDIRARFWYNPNLNYKLFMVPGILAFLVTMIGAYLTALNIVKEKETGTIEQINVTPVKKVLFILGKLIPFWIIGMLIFSFGFFVIAGFIYNIKAAGSIILLYAFLCIYLFAILSIGLLISNYSSNQQQAMSLAYFFIMIFILMSGLFTPVSSMPVWGQWIAWLNPVTHFIEVMRMVVIKGSSAADIANHFWYMIGFSVIMFTWAILSYHKNS